MGNGIVMSKLEFISPSEVNIYMMEQTVRANYRLDAKQVILAVNGQQEVFNLDSDGCLTGEIFSASSARVNSALAGNL